DFLNDDHGAAGVPDNSNPVGPNAFLFAPVAGTFTYPTDPVYANNAADLVELRVKPLADATAFRVTLDTLKDPSRTAFTIALGASDAPRAWPHGAGVSSPAALFLTVHGASAELLDAAAGGAVQAAWWRERAQADALRLGGVSGFSADVDFAKLAAGADDDSGVPKTGPIDRILASRHEFGQGMDPSKVCFDLASNF